MDLKEGRDVRFMSLSLLHNVDRNGTWCRQRCCAGGTRPCHVLVVRTMVKVDLALTHSFAIMVTSFFNRFFAIAESVDQILPGSIKM